MESDTYDNQDRLETYTGATYNTYTYTANGELVTKTVNGVPTNYTYDALGNLLTVAPQGGPMIEYIVDAQNRRIRKSVGGTFAQAFLWEDQLRIAAELDATGAVVSRFVYGTRVNVPDYMVRNPGTAEEKAYRIVTDHLGSVRFVVDAADGTWVQRMAYDEFGRVLEQECDPSLSAAECKYLHPFGFAGGLYDPDTGLVRFGVRDYDPLTGQWTTKDEMLFAGGDTNLYGYVLHDPLNLIDPDGLCPLIGPRGVLGFRGLGWAPRRAAPNSIYERVTPEGSLRGRTFYDSKGRQLQRQDFDHQHGGLQPHEHPLNPIEKPAGPPRPLPPGYESWPIT